ncbi:D-threonine aldolase [Scenedesmus sp. PABB004]|nr:D-threonine aldolase [Scenedesmus sp. PABB004]
MLALGRQMAAAAAAARPGLLQARGCSWPGALVQAPAARRAAASASAGARLGAPLAEVDTPALVVDLDAFEANCLKLRRVMAADHPGVAVRPHAKAHKCPHLAALQLRLLGDVGAGGVCAQKVSEAEALVAGGIADVLVSNEVVDLAKLDRLAALAAQGARVSVVVDARAPLQALAAAARAWETSVGVLVEVNAGQDRCGVDTPAEAAALAGLVAELAEQTRGAVTFQGVQAYHGGIQHVRDPGERAAAVARVAARAAAAVEAIAAGPGLACGTVTGGGTGTYRLEAGSGVFTEVQPGSFALGDADYARNRQAGGGGAEWEQALWVLAQVMSVSEARGAVVCDAGQKAVSYDSGAPLLLEAPSVAAGLLRELAAEGVEVANGGDEHAVLLWPRGLHQAPPPALPGLGAKLLLLPGHCDPTVNLYDEVVAARCGRVFGVWPIARGPGRCAAAAAARVNARSMCGGAALAVTRFCEHLQEWEDAVAAGGAALAGLAGALAQLQPPQGVPALPKVLQRLEELAPSFQLSAYLEQLQRPVPKPDPELPAASHAAFASLQAALAAAAAGLRGMQARAAECADAALARAPVGEQGAAAAGAGAVDGLAAPGVADGDGAAAEHGGDAAEQSPDPPQPPASAEELALLLGAAVAGLQRDLQWMELAAASIRLDTPAEHLEAFAQLWELQPFTDEAALDAPGEPGARGSCVRLVRAARPPCTGGGGTARSGVPRPPARQLQQLRLCTSRSVAAGSGLLRGAVAAHVPGLDELLLPPLAGWLAIRSLSAVADRARRWLEANPDQPLSVEVLGLLPVALEAPACVAISLFVSTRVLRSAAGLLKAFVVSAEPAWEPAARRAAGCFVAALNSVDAALVPLTAVLAVWLTVRVLIRWKSVLLEHVIAAQRAKEAALHNHRPHHGPAADHTPWPDAGGAAAGAAAAAAQRAGDAGEAGETCLEGGGGRVLSVAMRPRWPSGAEQAAELSDEEGAPAPASAAAPAAAAGLASGGSFTARRGGRATGASLWGPKSAEQMERLLLPLDGILSWVLVVAAALFSMQLLGIDVRPLLAIGGASGIVVGLATQTLLTNAVMGLSIFLSRPFVPGDSIVVQGVGNVIVSGTVERVTPMRTLVRGLDDELVAVPNKSISDMVVYNKSARREARSPLTSKSRERQTLRFKVKLPHKELAALEELTSALSAALRRPGVAQRSIKVSLSRFTDAGAELLVSFLLLVSPTSASGQRLLLDLGLTARAFNGVIVTIN